MAGTIPPAREVAGDAASLPEGMRILRISRGDAEPLRAEVEALGEAAAAADGARPFNDATLLGLRDRIGAIARDADGRLLGAVLAEDLPERVDGELAVHPAARRRGLGAALAAELERLAADRPVLAWAHGRHPGALALARRRGFEPIRELRRLALPLSDEARARIRSDAQAPAPEGVRIEPFRAGEDEPRILAVNAEAFRDHPEQGALDADGLADRMREPWFDPRALLVAREEPSGRVLGFNWLKIDGDEAEIYVLGVADDAAGRGIGRALMRRGLALLAESGRAEASLYVEGGNERALGLYRSLGFEDDAIDLQLRRG